MAPKGNETLLVVDDDRSILDLIIDTLQPLGYTLIDATCAEEVLEFIERSDTQFDLLLTDMVMPGMNGGDLAKSVKEKYLETKVIFMSGYTKRHDCQPGNLVNWGNIYAKTSFAYESG